VNLNELRLVVDEREKKSRIPDLLKAVGINVEVKTLPIGDYIVFGYTKNPLYSHIQIRHHDRDYCDFQIHLYASV